MKTIKENQRDIIKILECLPDYKDANKNKKRCGLERSYFITLFLPAAIITKLNEKAREQKISVSKHVCNICSAFLNKQEALNRLTEAAKERNHEQRTCKI